MKSMKDRSNDVINAMNDLSRNRQDDPDVVRELVKIALLALHSITTTHSVHTDNLLHDAETALQNLRDELGKM